MFINRSINLYINIIVTISYVYIVPDSYTNCVILISIVISGLVYLLIIILYIINIVKVILTSDIVKAYNTESTNCVFFPPILIH